MKLYNPHALIKIRMLKIIEGLRATSFSKLVYTWIKRLSKAFAMGLKISGKILISTEKMSRDAMI